MCVRRIWLTINGERVAVPCGKCTECRKSKVKQWSYRFQDAAKNSAESYFVTLTYAPEYLPITETGYPNVSPQDVDYFFHRLRKLFVEEYKREETISKSGKMYTKRIPVYSHHFKYFLVAEYGPNFSERSHYHFLMFLDETIEYDELFQKLQKAWNKGFITLGRTFDTRIQYCANYFLQDPYRDDESQNYTFYRCSKGLGWSDDDIRIEYWAQHGTRYEHGYRVPLSKCYKTHIEKLTEIKPITPRYNTRPFEDFDLKIQIAIMKNERIAMEKQKFKQRNKHRKL